MHLGLDERTEMLSEILPEPCKCSRCIYERNAEQQLNGDSTITELLMLASAAQKQERYDDALSLYEVVFRKCPSNERCLYNRQRVAGWNDEPMLATRLLREAFEIAPSCAKISNAMKQHMAYCKGSQERLTYAGKITSHVDGNAFVVENLLDRGECGEILRKIEEHQWSTLRHYSVPTTDIAVHTHPELLKWFNTQMEKTVFPVIGNFFDDVAPSNCVSSTPFSSATPIQASAHFLCIVINRRYL